MEKPRRSLLQIFNMSLGFFGIQFGWGLQMANMSAIYEYLGAKPEEIAILWLAAPITGLIVQPIIGQASDRTWTRLGRRRPYFLAGAILSSLALIAMPQSKTLWMAAGLLWILDASINISMEPFRAFVADLLPEEQRTRGFAMQALLIGLGAVLGSALPYILSNVFHVQNVPGEHIPTTVRWSFYLGSASFFATVLWTVLSTREIPPDDIAAFRRANAEKSGLVANARDIYRSILQMPATMRQLAWVQFFTWSGLFCMFLYFGVAIARTVFRAPDQSSPLYTQGIEWGGICFAVYNAVCFGFSFFLPNIARALGRKNTHALCLLMGAAGLISVRFIGNPYVLLLSMVGVGIAWASILSMPYAILAGSLSSEKTGVYMGIFNFFIVLPEITVAILLRRAIPNILNEHPVTAVVIGGVLMGIAALLTQRVYDPLEARGRVPQAQAADWM